MTRILGLIIIIAAVFSCDKLNRVDSNKGIVELSTPKPVLNFSGDTLQAKTFSDTTYQVLLNKMLDAKALSKQFPDSVELAIWHGRRVAYMGRYHEAIDVFSEAIKRFPTDYRLLRHRGHRYLTTRQLDLAIADFEKAARLCKDAPNAIEPDGIPNKMNTPLGNDKFNIYYHQGLAYYLNGEFEKAVPVYEQCLAVSDNDDLKVATSYWLYMTLHRIGMEGEATQLLEEISTEMNIIENDAYLDLLMLFKGVHTKMPIHPTYGYGQGFNHLKLGELERAEKMWRKVLEHPSWDSFGYIAAESEGN
jgi:tetratricopeptide (TPR) repeat protein